MTQRDDLMRLAERVEALAGPDREVDAEIAAAIRWCPWGKDHWVNDLSFPFRANPNGRVQPYDQQGPLPGGSWEAPRYTASIDAAMTLALPHWWLEIGAPLSPDAYGYSREDQRMPRAGFQMIGEPYSAASRAATLPLALTAASLRAAGGRGGSGRGSGPGQDRLGEQEEAMTQRDRILCRAFRTRSLRLYRLAMEWETMHAPNT